MFLKIRNIQGKIKWLESLFHQKHPHTGVFLWICKLLRSVWRSLLYKRQGKKNYLTCHWCFWPILICWSAVPRPTLGHCVQRVRIPSIFDSYYPIFNLNTAIYSLDLCIQSEDRKIRTRKTPHLDKCNVSINYSLTVLPKILS